MGGKKSYLKGNMESNCFQNYSGRLLLAVFFEGFENLAFNFLYRINLSLIFIISYIKSIEET
jgi:hypothetical protein